MTFNLRNVTQVKISHSIDIPFLSFSILVLKVLKAVYDNLINCFTWYDWFQRHDCTKNIQVGVLNKRCNDWGMITRE